ncbi:gliding motility-associated C-terminal domain-containing protein [Aquimarina sp. I32.4]|uniref:T9SS type B sorting domain-containing protein n=1 Tax=Aquimarina sp. I32.4 TaxID=2053903 RepID=UPI0013050311|nr:gliding motility-associated C-terminal domain-containing protein [Aquimarina sp. I32.4]
MTWLICNFGINSKIQAICILLFCSSFVSFGQGCPDVQISDTNDTHHFSQEGKNETDDMGESVSELGDVNGDGISDIIVGAPGVDDGTVENIGEAYVVFGGTGITSASVDINTLDGTNGFVVRGIVTGERLGYSVSRAGDINNDGLEDVLIGTYSNDVIIIFGSTTGFLPLYTRSDIDGVNGILIEDTNSHQNVSNAGDVNRDGIDDIIIGGALSTSGKAYVVYGNPTIGSINSADLDGTNGFVIQGFSGSFRWDGIQVSNAGDINNDGVEDLVLGFPRYNEGATRAAGRVAVIFGRNTNFAATFELSTLNGTNGFYITEDIEYESLGNSVAPAKDFNNDGVDDLAIASSRKAYVLYGKNTTFSTSFRVSDLPDGDKFVFEAGWYLYPYRISDLDGLSDVNSDGITDLIVSVPHWDGYARSGGAYILYGGTALPNKLQSLELKGTNGYQIFDDQRYSYKGFGHSVSNAGDFNNDGFNDFIVGEKLNNSDTYRTKGAFHVFFGNTLDVIDTEDPIINCPNGVQELYTNTPLPNYIQFLASATDNCSYNTDMVYTQTPPEGTLFTSNTSVTITATDRSGNTGFCSFTVNLETSSEEIDCSTTNFSISNLNGTNGFTLYGEEPHSETGYDVNTAGDVNNDGIDDFIVVAKGDVVNFTGPYRGYHINVIGGVYIVYGTTSGFPSNIFLKDLSGSDGFKISNELIPYVKTGSDNHFYKADTAGDVNNDGIDDIILSEPFRRSDSGGYRAGAVYVIFGSSSGFTPIVDLSTIDGTNGFVIKGISQEFLGIDLDNLGDINGDGIDDIIIANSSNDSRNIKGKCFIVYGSGSGFPASIKTDEINGVNGCVITNSGTSLHVVSRSVANVGDTNGDGINDIVIGGNTDRKHVVFGRSSNYPATLNVEDLNGANGFAVTHSVVDITYAEVGATDDINNDGFKDISFRNQFVLFGKNTFSAEVDLATLDGTNGFSFSSNLSMLNHIGDFNNDGYQDVIIKGSSSTGGVLYGKATWEATVPTSFGVHTYGFRVDEFSSYSIKGVGAYAGDVNNDGIDDLIIGRYRRYAYNYLVNSDPGFAHVIFGKNIPDIEAPQITTCPSNQILASGSNLPDYRGSVVATDDCDTNLEITQSPDIGTSFTANTTITITVRDNSGKETRCNFEVTIPGVDTEDPTASNPLPINIQCSTDIPTADPLVVTDEADNSGDTPTVAFVSDVSDGGSNPEVVTRTYSVTDGAGNSINVTQTITINDTSNPTASNPSAITVSCATDVPTPDIAVVTDAADNCGTPVVAFVDDTPIGTTISRRYSVTDGAGNSINVTQTITINDTSNPTASNPPTITVNCATDVLTPDIAVVTDAADNCGTPVVAFVDDTPIGTTISRRYSVTDGAGNSINVTQTITINDTSNPTASNPSAITVSCVTDVPTPDIAVVTDAADNCGTPVIAFVDDTPTGTTISRRYSVTDGARNSIDVVQTITISDTERPTIDCLSNQSLDSGTVLPDYTSLVTVLDNCDNSPVLTQLPVAGSPFVDGMTVEMTVTDTSGNSNQCSFIITTTIVDTDGPVISGCLIDQELSCDASSVLDYRGLLTVIDNIDTNPIIIQNPPAGSPIIDGMQITITATDASDNSSDCVFRVYQQEETVEAGEDQDIREGEIVQLHAEGTSAGTYSWSPSIGLSASDIVNPMANPNQTVTYTVVFTSNQGCITEDSITVYVVPRLEDQTRYGFSPDGDGVNEYWEIHGIEEYPNNKVSIYNRWGDLVYEAEGYDNNAKTFKGIANRKRSLGGDELPEGTYFFNIKINGPHNLKKETGFLVLKR